MRSNIFVHPGPRKPTSFLIPFTVLIGAFELPDQLEAKLLAHLGFANARSHQSWKASFPVFCFLAQFKVVL